MTATFPPRRLLAVAAALALFGGQADAKSQPRPKTSLDGSSPTCPLGSLRCEPRPYNYAICRPNALLEFYDPLLGTDTTLRETSATDVLAEKIDSSNQSVYRLEGNVKLTRADQQLQADAVDYNDETTDYDARGNVRYQQAGQLLAGSHMRGNTAASRGVADDVRYQMLDSRGNGVAQQGEMLDANRSRYMMATYSTCDIDDRVWEVRAKSISTDKESGVGVARGTTMRLGNVPFLYLPYFSFPLDNRRKTGFLFPTFGKTSRTGFQVSTPYYLNLAPNYDATLDPRFYSLRGPMLAGEFRYLLPRSRGQLSVEYAPRDHGDSSGLAKTKNESRYLIRLSSNTQLWKQWRFVTSINRTSDSSYLYDYGNLMTDNAVYTLSSRAAILGSGKYWNAAFGGVKRQNTNPFATDAVLQYDQLPYATFNLDLPVNRWLEFGMDDEAVKFRKTHYLGGTRLDLYPYLQADFAGAAWFVRPRVGYRYTAYQLSGDYANFGYNGRLPANVSTPFTDRSPSRALPIVNVDSGLIFDRSTSLFGSSYTQTLEPRLYYLYVPYRNQDHLPRFDTSEMSFDYWQLFSTNRFSGADRQMDANNLTAAMTSRLLDENGIERFSVSLGQIRYFSPQRVQMPSGRNASRPETDWSGSDYVVQMSAQLNDDWRVRSAYQWSPNTRQTSVGAFGFQRRIGTDGVLNLSYNYRRNRLEQYSASAVYPLSDRWRLVGAWTYAKPVKGVTNPIRGTIDALAGIEYDSCCVTLRLVDRTYINQNYFGFGATPANSNRRDNALMFEVVFKGLGSSSGQIDALLRRDILGYQ